MRPGYPFKKIHFDEMTNEEVMDGTLSPKRNLSSLFETSALEIRKIFQMIRRRRCAVSQIERGGIGNISFPEFSFLLSAIRNDKHKIYFFIFLAEGLNVIGRRRKKEREREISLFLFYYLFCV